ncbi:hypothetical protein GW17_00009440 [Ensete ventricosum]|nr:hypothetical protein GW17_00009440 [Ensete ventricosum]
MANLTQPISQTPPSHYGSKGSFGPVFVVLGAIVVLAVAACVIGRLCTRRVSRGEAKQSHRSHSAKGDLENPLGFTDPTMATAGRKEGGGSAATTERAGERSAGAS